MWRSETPSTGRCRVRKGLGPRPAASMKVLLDSHAVPIYFGLAFAISWGGLPAVGGLGSLSAAIWQIPGCRCFPGVACRAEYRPLLTSPVSGRSGLSELPSRVAGWQVGPSWRKRRLRPHCNPCPGGCCSGVNVQGILWQALPASSLVPVACRRRVCLSKFAADTRRTDLARSKELDATPDHEQANNGDLRRGRAG
jgi:hypothetical protein